MYEARLRENLPLVRARIEAAAERAGRSDAITIVAVTKTHPVAAVQAALAAGLTDCGENRVGELEEKVEAAGRSAVRWHLIGHLQRNKSRRAVELFDLIHSVDSLRLAQALSAEGERTGSPVRGLIQVNVSGEETKGGIEALADPEAALPGIAEIAALPGLAVVGLMTMAPFTGDQAMLRRTFQRARRLFERCGSQVPGFRAEQLSMGMSNDFELAVEEGSTMVRLGTTLFGERQI